MKEIAAVFLFALGVVAVTIVSVGAVESNCLAPDRVVTVAPTLDFMHKWAAEEGKAEYYLDPKTGEVAWRWKQQTVSYGGSLYLNTP